MSRQQWTGSGALNISFTVEPEVGILLQDARLHLNSDSAKVEDYTITLDSAKGVEYDVRFMKHTMQDVDDIICDFEEFRAFRGDKIIFAWANSDSKTWGLDFNWDNFC